MEKLKSEVVGVFKEIEAKFPTEALGKELWYLLTLAALTGGPAPYPELAAELYLYLITKQEYQTPESRKALVRRLREALVKCISIIGVCKPLESIFAIGHVERPEDKDYTCSRENWQCDEENVQRGQGWLDKIYLHNKSVAENWLEAHKDFDWVTKNITYGLYLSDRAILNDLETEIIVLAGIMIQNLKTETHWHLRGTRRIGVSAEHVEILQQCVEHLAKFMGVALDRVPRVKDVENEV